MKTITVLTLATALLAVGTASEEVAARRKATPPVTGSDAGDFCIFTGDPPSDIQYEVIRKIKFGKQSYGSAITIVPRLADRARMYGGNAIVRYKGSQGFGFWPWRAVRPVVSGMAIRWQEPLTRSCEEMGGIELEDFREKYSAHR